jgi:NitT/TauT family transport system substrate-binding protein
MEKTLQDHAGEVGKAKIVQGAFGTLLAMLDADTADVAMELEPTVSTAVKQGARVVYSYPEMYGPFLLTGLYTTEDYRDKHREICQKVVNALERAVRYAHSDVQGTVEIARKVFPELDADVVKNAVERMLQENTIPHDVTIEPKAWDNAIQARIQVGDLKSRDVAQETVDGTFAKQAVTAVGAEQK